MKIPLPIRMYADFECINQPQNNPNTEGTLCNPKVSIKQFPIGVAYYLISPFGNNYFSYICKGCVKWLVKEMWTLEKNAINYFKTNLELQITPQEEEKFQEAKVCWLCGASFAVPGAPCVCEKPFDSLTQNATEGIEGALRALRKVRNHDILTGHYRGTAQNKCI